MNKEELTELFCSKVSLELERFKRMVLRLKPEEIYGKSYEIECMVNISEILIEKSERMEADILKCLMVLPNVLRFFYSRWMKVGDSFMEELEGSMDRSIRELQKKIGITEKEEAA